MKKLTILVFYYLSTFYPIHFKQYKPFNLFIYSLIFLIKLHFILAVKKYVKQVLFDILDLIKKIYF